MWIASRSVLKGSKQTSTEQRSNKIPGVWFPDTVESHIISCLHEMFTWKRNKSLFKPLLFRVFCHLQLSLSLKSTCYGLHFVPQKIICWNPNSQNYIVCGIRSYWRKIRLNGVIRVESQSNRTDVLKRRQRVTRDTSLTLSLSWETGHVPT